MSNTTEIAKTDAVVSVQMASKAQAAAWEKQGETLRKSAAGQTWKVADWYLSGAGYGFAKRAAEILDGLYSEASLHTMGKVANVFTVKTRNPHVSFGIHNILVATARKDMPAAQAILAQAETERLTVVQVKELLGLGGSQRQAITDGSEGDGEGTGDGEGSPATPDALAKLLALVDGLSVGQLAELGAAIKAKIAEKL